jgi:hypothetical protein
LPRGGYYLARVTVQTPQFAREQQILFAVSPKTASFAGNVAAHATASAVIIDAAINVARAGDFAIGATMRNARGTLVASLTTPMTLQAGTQAVSITIPGAEIRARGIDGPYNIELILMDASWAAVPVDELPKAIATDAWRASDFGE